MPVIINTLIRMEDKEHALNMVKQAELEINRFLREVQLPNSYKEKAYAMSQVEFAAFGLARFNLFLGKDIRYIKQMFYLAALADHQDYLFWKAAIDAGEVDMVYFKAHVKNVSSTVSYGMLFAILSDNWSFCQDFARNRKQLTPVEFKDLLLCAQTLFHLILDEQESAKDKLMALKGLKKVSGQISGYAQVFEGILYEQPDMIETGIKKQLTYHKRKNNYSILVGTSLSATMLAKLASRYGFHTPIFEAPYIHKGLLQMHTDIEYMNQYNGINFPTI